MVSVHSRVSCLFCCWSVSTSCSVCDHARAHSGVEHTSAVSTGTVRDPCDQPSSSPRATSSRSPCTGSSCSSSSPGVLLLLSARGLTRDQSSCRVPSHPLRSLFFNGLVSAEHWFHAQPACSRYAVCSLLVLVVMRDWCLARVWLEQRASPSLLADRLGALNHSLLCISAFVSSRFSRSRPLPSCFCMHHEFLSGHLHAVNHRVTRLFFQGISDLARGFAAFDLSLAILSSGCSCIGTSSR